MIYNTPVIYGIIPLRSNVLVRDIEQGDKVTQGGIIILDDNGKNRGIRPRTCVVYSVGTDIDYVKPGDVILVSHARWTRGVTMEKDGESFNIHMVDPKDILAVVEQ